MTFESFLLPPGATLDPSTGLFDWTPSYYMRGVYTVPFTVVSGSESVTKTATYTVINANAAPEFDDFGGFRGFEGQPLTVAVFAFDPDNPAYEHPYRNAQGELIERNFVPPSVTVSASNLPSGMTFDPLTTFLTWTPSYEQAGTYHVSFTATDDGDGTGLSLSTVTTIEFMVLNQNRAPEIAAIANQTVRLGEVLDVPVQVADADGNPIALRAESGMPGFPLPPFITFTDHGDGSGVFHAAPARAAEETTVSSSLRLTTATETIGPTWRRRTPLFLPSSPTTNRRSSTLSAPNLPSRASRLCCRYGHETATRSLCNSP